MSNSLRHLYLLCVANNLNFFFYLKKFVAPYGNDAADARNHRDYLKLNLVKESQEEVTAWSRSSKAVLFSVFYKARTYTHTEIWYVSRRGLTVCSGYITT